MARDPERRARSREMDKIRKRTRRAIERLEKQRQTTTDMKARHAAAQQLTQLQAQLDKTYAHKTGNRRYSIEALRAGRNLREQKVSSTRELQKSGFNFQKELSKASQGKVSALGERGTLKAKIFYRATQNAWQGLPNNQRAQAIMDALGCSSIEEAYNLVMNTPEVREILRQNGTTADTNELSEAYENAERTDRRYSGRTEVLAVTMLEFAKAYASA